MKDQEVGRERPAPLRAAWVRVVDGRIAEITTFGAELFPAFGLPLVLDDVEERRDR